MKITGIEKGFMIMTLEKEILRTQELIQKSRKENVYDLENVVKRLNNKIEFTKNLIKKFEELA